MQTTTNYGFKVYESGDYFNPLTTNNYNVGAIDTDLKAVSDRAIANATEVVSSGVHAITLLDTDCATFKFIATGNYAVGETFTLNGVAINGRYPDGTALSDGAFVTGATVMCSRNADDTLLTFYLSSVGGVAPDSEKLGGELPSYYATKSYADGIKSTADNASTLIQKKALVNTYYDTSAHKLYVVNSDGTRGAEINMSKELDLTNKVEITTTAYTTTKAGAIVGSLPQNKKLLVDGDNKIFTTPNVSGSSVVIDIQGVPSGTTLSLNASMPSDFAVYFVPYK